MRSDGNWVVFHGWTAAVVLAAVLVPWAIGAVCIVRWLMGL
jgi:hypothetical protein